MTMGLKKEGSPPLEEGDTLEETPTPSLRKSLTVKVQKGGDIDDMLNDIDNVKLA